MGPFSMGMKVGEKVVEKLGDSPFENQMKGGLSVRGLRACYDLGEV